MKQGLNSCLHNCCAQLLVIFRYNYNSKKMFTCCLSRSVLYHFSRTGGQQLFRQTAKAHVDHIAEGFKKKKRCTMHRVMFLQNTRRQESSSQSKIWVKNPVLVLMCRIIRPPDWSGCPEQSRKPRGRTLSWSKRWLTHGAHLNIMLHC